MFSSNNQGQAQRAGAESVQIQAARDVNIGITEDRARQISLESAKFVLDEYTNEGIALIQDRLLKLDDRVIASLVRENRLHVFADPGFQRTYRKAQEGAAVSDRDSDFDLLSSLVADRAERGADRPIRAGIDRAIEVVDRMDTGALRGLTVLQAVHQYSPVSGRLEDGIAIMVNLLEQLLDGPLPTGGDWLDHLDLLDTIRINPLSSLRKFEDFWPTSHLAGYISQGRLEHEAPALWNFEEYSIPWPTVPHDFKPDYVRVAAASISVFESKHLTSLRQPARDAMVKDAKEIFLFDTIDENCRAPLMEKIREQPALRTIEEWWNQIPSAANVTAAGRALARANAERLDLKKILPPLE
ncbi:LPO_1073/Vpar_1526 family protein [Glutamicibacter sp. 0426]|uniref:LPO_1073/Vpar_1526 family protein n=1 Tax=Glutamicibacter sp. 0426 TaxID=1913445 RepID=UPI00093913D7|nr:LPO_1073/Vpar_1526 family protein [Glutamicibacter sp. 0426]